MPAEKEDYEAPIEDAEVIWLSADDQRRFVALLLDPPPITPALQRAREAHARLIKQAE